MENYLDFFKENEYITSGDVARILQIDDSTIRFYCNEFDDFIKVIKVKKRRYFKAEHIERLIYIKYLIKEKRLPLRLVKEFLQTEDGQNMKPIDKVIETPLFSMMRQVSETLERFANNQDKDDMRNANSSEHGTENITGLLKLLQKANLEKQERIEEVSIDTTIGQIDFQILNIKNCIGQYEIAKQHQFYDEMITVLNSLVSSADKIKLLNNGLQKLI